MAVSAAATPVVPPPLQAFAVYTVEVEGPGRPCCTRYLPLTANSGSIPPESDRHGSPAIVLNFFLSHSGAPSRQSSTGRRTKIEAARGSPREWWVPSSSLTATTPSRTRASLPLAACRGRDHALQGKTAQRRPCDLPKRCERTHPLRRA